ncbi:MAG: copper resistance protein NlpE [Bacteroidetes bacterium]|nr:copper resistance protein NlpE [Bacteroidota bacterium]
MNLTKAYPYQAALAVAFFVCLGCDPTSTSNTSETDSLTTTDLFSDFETDYDTESSPFDYTGTYTGLLPCTDCAGIKTEIVLTDSTYTKRTIYLGEARPDLYEASGGATWDGESQILTLGGITPPNRYLVQGNTLTQLDRQGRKVTGRLANRYILQKE